MNQGGWSKKPNFSYFFIWSTDSIEQTDFGQLMVTQSNETDNPF